MEFGSPKQVVWIASALEDSRKFPEPVRQLMGFAIFQAQCGFKHSQAKPLKGFKGHIDIIKSRLEAARRVHASRCTEEGL
jgi:phage-related protein